MKHPLVLFVSIFSLCIALAGCGNVSSTAQLGDKIQKGPNGLWGVETKPIQRPNTKLLDSDGKVVDLSKAYPDTMMLLFMGYTSCPDICPVHLATINRALEKLGWQAGRDVQLVFVASDPYRDNAQTVKAYVDKFNPHFVGLHADLDTINATADQLDLPHPVFEGDPKSGKFYTVGHPTQVMVFDKSGPSCISYPFGVLSRDWVEDLPKLKDGVCK